MRNLEIISEDDSALVLGERLVSRIFFGTFLWFFAVIAGFVGAVREGTGQLVAAVISGALFLLGASSLWGRGFVRIDSITRTLTVMVGPRKLIRSPRVVTFDAFEGLALREWRHKHNSTFMLTAKIRGSAVHLTIDHNADRAFLLDLGQKIARRVGCPFRDAV